MAGKNNPWGGSGKGDEPGGDGGSGAGGSGGPDGPRNPWLPGGGEPGKRRSASIEDIFKGRGPEGPRRAGGGPGGPAFRLPERPGGKSWLPVIIGSVALIWAAASSVHFVQPGEQAVVTWLGGKYSDTL
ncbi:MAG: protease modulator HflK, partial [Erythrobacter sp.]|nr:protease modulator HflK [Erythrobacter sp.]